MIEAIAFIALISVFGMISATLRAAKKSSGSARPQRAPERPQTVRGGAPAAKAAMAYGGSPLGKAGMAFGVPAGAQPGRNDTSGFAPAFDRSEGEQSAFESFDADAAFGADAVREGDDPCHDDMTPVAFGEAESKPAYAFDAADLAKGFVIGEILNRKRR